MMALLASKLPVSQERLYEVKWDGYRTIAVKEDRLGHGVGLSGSRGRLHLPLLDQAGDRHSNDCHPDAKRRMVSWELARSGRSASICRTFQSAACWSLVTAAVWSASRASRVLQSGAMTHEIAIRPPITRRVSMRRRIRCNNAGSSPSRVFRGERERTEGLSQERSRHASLDRRTWRRRERCRVCPRACSSWRPGIRHQSVPRMGLGKRPAASRLTPPETLP